MNIADLSFYTQTDFEDAVADSIKSREREIFDYLVSKAVLQATQAQIGEKAAWPDELAKYRTLRPDRVAEALTGADLETVNTLQLRDRIDHLLITTNQECAKSEAALAGLRDSLPPETLAAAISRKKAETVVLTEPIVKT